MWSEAKAYKVSISCNVAHETVRLIPERSQLARSMPWTSTPVVTAIWNLSGNAFWKLTSAELGRHGCARRDHQRPEYGIPICFWTRTKCYNCRMFVVVTYGSLTQQRTVDRNSYESDRHLLCRHLQSDKRLCCKRYLLNPI